MGVACIPHQLVSTFFESGLYEVGVNWPEGYLQIRCSRPIEHVVVFTGLLRQGGMHSQASVR